jgi:hypothetical protein
VNAIVAIMCYTGYNVEDAILINEGAVQRGIFRTTYYSSYETREESSKINGMNNSKFANIEKNNVIGKKRGHDYSFLDDHGLVRENTELNDKIILIGKINSSMNNKDVWTDDSVKTKKGQLGYVDKAFITHGEEGFNVAKVRVREERLPAIGDKMASRAGQKGTLGLIIPEEDMPFTEDGIRPDLIINPHAIPSRMTIGQIVESLFGKVCTSYGAYGDCTAFQVKGPNYSTYAPLLVNAGFHSSGNQVLYNGMSGQQLAADIYIGPTYYMRLKHMVKDKINYRARGPNTVLTRQPVQGRANDGGLRIGEMERDGVLAHGMSYFLNESFMVRGEKQDYFIAVCNKTGAIAIYNESKNLFLSPCADGPIKFNTNPDGTQSIMNLSRFGRSFSILRVPYAFKLLIHELQIMNVQMRIITEENVDQLLSMTFSNNINKLMKSDADAATIISEINSSVDKIVREVPKAMANVEANVIPEPAQVITPDTPVAAPGSPAYNPNTPDSIQGSPAYNPNTPDSIPYAPGSPAYNPNTPDSIPYAPGSPVNSSNSIPYAPGSPSSTTSQAPSPPSTSTPNFYETSVASDGKTAVQPKYNFPDDLNYYYMNLPKEEKIKIENYSNEAKIEYLKNVKANKRGGSTPNILDVATPPEPVPTISKTLDTSSENNTSDASGGTKKIIL